VVLEIAAVTLVTDSARDLWQKDNSKLEMMGWEVRRAYSQ
jgi:hypothetical protein